MYNSYHCITSYLTSFDVRICYKLPRNVVTNDPYIITFIDVKAHLPYLAKNYK